MKITSTISRWDLLRFNLYLAPRLPANWIAAAVMAAIGFVYLSSESSHPMAASTIATNLFIAFVGGIAGITAGTAVCIIFMLLFVNAASGVLGEHEYEIRPEGLFEKTAANEGLNRWPGIKAITRSSQQIYVRINSYLCHVIPRHGFANDREFDLFYDALLAHWRAAT